MKRLIITIGLTIALCGILSSCKEIKGGPVEYTSGNVALKGYLAYDNSIKGKRPGILVVHEWWGHNDYARKRAMMLAGLGYTALAVDMYGDGKQAEHPDDAGKFAKEISSNMDVKISRFMAAMDFLIKQESVDPARIAAIGYCFGGGVVLDMARSGMDLRGVVSFHGGLTTNNPARPGAVKAKILVCHGEADTFITAEQIAAFKKEMSDAGADMQFITYKDAKHSFTNPEADSYAQKFKIPVGYNSAADKKSWEDMKKFLKDIF
ncbi:MAG: dienelactone hydrolase family protein [Nitrospirae bacterium]|nr:dienelactone hydrolase family protein [Nitrospirota bacterium]